MFKKIVLSIVIFGFIAVALAVGGGFYLYHNYKKMSVSATSFNELKEGTSEAEVKKALPEHAQLSAKDVYKAGDSQQASLPSGADCVYYLARGQDLDNAGAKVYRFCFKNGKLTEKKAVVATA